MITITRLEAEHVLTAISETQDNLRELEQQGVFVDDGVWDYLMNSAVILNAAIANEVRLDADAEGILNIIP